MSVHKAIYSRASVCSGRKLECQRGQVPVEVLKSLSYTACESTKRAGWIRRGIENGESVADHMYRMASLAFLVGHDKNINKDRCIKLALVHDMAECIVGDITPADGVSKESKHQQEKTAMDYITSLVDKETGDELKSLWLEYDSQSSAEAQFVKDLDRFDMILQAYEYENTQKEPKKLQEFFDSTKGKFQHPMVQGWVQELYQWREKTETVHNSGDD